MSLFNGIEKDEPSSRGILGRFRALRAGFTDESPASMPIAGAGRKDETNREPRFVRKDKPLKAEPVDTKPGQPMTLGMRLRMAEVTDVDTNEGDPYAATGGDPAQPEATGHPARVEPSIDHMGEARQASENVAGTTRDVGPESEMESPMMERPTAESGEPRVEAHDVAPQAVPPTGSADEMHEVHELHAQADVVSQQAEFLPSGLPQLVAADALGFKRILSERGQDATLRITDSARREFVAVEVQAGMAIVITTRAFHESALYPTYVKDLERADIKVHEEMIATDAVIAAIYARERNRSAAIIPESSRAIGTFRDVTEAAVAYGAGDIHYEYRDFNDDVEARFRVNGDLYTYRKLPKALVRRALSAAYQDLVARNTNSGETFQPTASQSAMIPLVVQSDIVNIRWQSSPLVGGFDVGLRLLDGNFRNLKVLMPEQMGLQTSQLHIIQALGNVSGGVTVLTGETGSAKSTLLRAMSFMLASRDLRKQFAVNEPSEYPQPWLSDISIPRRPDETDEEANRKCAEVIRTLMRMDPDDVTVGEIRDRVVAGLVAELALTGHPVRTTLHADSAIGAFMRLAGGRLQLPMDEVSSEKFINAVANQKLIPLLCPHCKVPARDVMPAAQIETLERKFGLDTSKMACRDEGGCEHCRLKGLFTRAGKVAAGTKGQTLAMEIFRPTMEFLDRVAQRDWRGAESVWRSARTSGFDSDDMTGKTIYEHALYKASQGIIDPRFIDTAMRPFDEYRIFADRDGRMPS
ncbi:type II secretory ATPase GspE/PulE/Tfp pilus assembly ATPase PilB-like protein [Paraburkholderia atlantica]|uniref:Type II secretory ATPase GspE/PulE/Tfp pilus assembly ATPase PilB-like protein n=1 Tax=Paraburkholderia atlantica TaxID=2654982 RepID=A0A7W8VAF9_PARAM|nr:ATPase, T2SS/T4P/T4SS family [Paraburkholderia atlantica]MBB5428815.1 type II secretory ATPase GspE/PulE/Tfp pilus assembly ATPase PilB-like protein [Paraburkholderia atlantica]NUY35642.1 secretion system protein E [Paraburkholderia atlantica]